MPDKNSHTFIAEFIFRKCNPKTVAENQYNIHRHSFRAPQAVVYAKCCHICVRAMEKGHFYFGLFTPQCLPNTFRELRIFFQGFGEINALFSGIKGAQAPWGPQSGLSYPNPLGEPNPHYRGSIYVFHFFIFELKECRPRSDTALIINYAAPDQGLLCLTKPCPPPPPQKRTLKRTFSARRNYLRSCIDVVYFILHTLHCAINEKLLGGDCALMQVRLSLRWRYKVQMLMRGSICLSF